MAAATAGITDILALPGLKSLWAKSVGDPGVCVAILDGPVDQSHICFDNANLTRLPTLVSDAVGDGVMSGHGTHITSVIFGQHGSPVPGIAPGCRGLIIPVFSDASNRKLSQLDLARSINQAVEAGAQVINISGGELSHTGEADQMLVNAVRYCNDNNVLIVAAAGNNGCQCLHVPAALPSVLAVGAMNAQGLPFDFSNWGDVYQTQGILAPGENILGAEPGGGTSLRSGTSFATPIVSGIVALLLSIQLARGDKPDPHAIRDAILKSALPCNSEVVEDCRRFLAGSLNIHRAYNLIAKGGIIEVSEENSKVPILETSEVADQTNPIENIQASDTISLSREESVNILPSTTFQAPKMALKTPTVMTIPKAENAMNVTPSQVVDSSVTNGGVVASEECSCKSGGSNIPKPLVYAQTQSLVYALGTIGYDFGTEARRDSFQQLMTPIDSPPRHPWAADQMVQYLNGEGLYEAKSLIWTLNIELTPIYAIEPEGTFAEGFYGLLRDFLAGQIKDKTDGDYIERVSIPGILTGRSVRLFSGQVVPVIVPQIRGAYSWNVNALIGSVVEEVKKLANSNATQMRAWSGNDDPRMPALRKSLREFLDRIYYEFRNLGTTSQERALNFAATNAFQAARIFAEEVLVDVDAENGKVRQLDSIEVERSPFCRMDSDCWDVKLKFFDPENDRRAKKVVRYTIDVSDVMPVTLGTPRSWSVAY